MLEKKSRYLIAVPAYSPRFFTRKMSPYPPRTWIYDLKIPRTPLTASTFRSGARVKQPTGDFSTRLTALPNVSHSNSSLSRIFSRPGKLSTSLPPGAFDTLRQSAKRQSRNVKATRGVVCRSRLRSATRKLWGCTACRDYEDECYVVNDRDGILRGLSSTKTQFFFVFL